MRFLEPAAFGFLAALPIIVLFYLLKRKRVVKLVPSTLLWQKFLAESQASAPFQRLRKNWLLLLQLLVAALVAFALARPFMPAEVRPAHRRVVILDTSASMKATDVQPSRFEQSRTEALKWVDNLRAGEEMVIVQAGAETLVRQSATQNKHALRTALQACQPSDGPTQLVPALQMAESLVRDQPGAEVHLFSDGATPPLSSFENRGLPLVFHKVGVGSNNLALVAIDSRMNPANSQERAVYASVANFSGARRQIGLDLLFDNELVETRSLDIPAGETSSQVFVTRQTRDGVYMARIAEKDDLASDNQASVVSRLPRPVQVLLVTSGNRLLERALKAAPLVELSTISSLDESARGFDLVVLDGVMPAAWPQANILAFRVFQTNWFRETSKLATPSIVDWRATHPLLRYAGFEEVGISESLAVKTPSWAMSLLDSPQASLMVAGELGRQRIVWVGFDPLDSNWPLRVSFPIFIANAVDWLGSSAQGGSLMVKTGDPFRVPLPYPVESASVVTPAGNEERFSPSLEATEFVYGRTLQQGIHKARVGTNNLIFCVNLLDAFESNIAPRDELNLGPRNTVAAAGVQRASLELWRGLALLGLAGLLAEWWYYHRRTA